MLKIHKNGEKCVYYTTIINYKLSVIRRESVDCWEYSCVLFRGCPTVFWDVFLFHICTCWGQGDLSLELPTVTVLQNQWWWVINVVDFDSLSAKMKPKRKLQSVKTIQLIYTMQTARIFRIPEGKSGKNREDSCRELFSMEILVCMLSFALDDMWHLLADLSSRADFTEVRYSTQHLYKSIF